MLADRYFMRMAMSLRDEGLSQAEADELVALFRQSITPHRLPRPERDLGQLQGPLGDLIENLRVDLIQVLEQVREEMRLETASMVSRQKSILVYNITTLWVIAAFIAALATIGDGKVLSDASHRLQEGLHAIAVPDWQA